MIRTLIRGPLTHELKNPKSPVRLFIEDRFPNLKTIQQRYAQDRPEIVVLGNEANPGTVGTACDWLLRFLLHPQPDVRLALVGVDSIPGYGPHIDVAVAELLHALGTPLDQLLPPGAPSPTFTGPVTGSVVEPERLARGCWALALLSEFYRAGPIAAGNGPLGRLDPVDPIDLLSLAPAAAIDQLIQLRRVLEDVLLPDLAIRSGLWALGPTFTGSRLIKADADVIAAGLLLDLKTSQGVEAGRRQPPASP